MVPISFRMHSFCNILLLCTNTHTCIFVIGKYNHLECVRIEGWVKERLVYSREQSPRETAHRYNILIPISCYRVRPESRANEALAGLRAIAVTVETLVHLDPRACRERRANPVWTGCPAYRVHPVRQGHPAFPRRMT